MFGRKFERSVNAGVRGAKVCVLLGCLLCPFAVPAAGDLGRQDPVRVTVQLGTPQGEHRFTPDALVFETGRLYALRIENAGTNDYYFHSPSMADAVYTRKVAALAGDGSVLAEIYGPVRRVEVKTGSAIEWWFIPIRAGRFDDLRSTRTHTEAGMRATVELK